MPYRRSESAPRRLPGPLFCIAIGPFPNLGGLQSTVTNFAGPRTKLAALEGGIPKAKEFEGGRSVYQPKRATKSMTSQRATSSAEKNDSTSGVRVELFVLGQILMDFAIHLRAISLS